MFDTQMDQIRRIRRVRAMQKVARINRQVNTTIEYGITVVCGLLLVGFFLNLFNVETRSDILLRTVQSLADGLVLPFKSLFSYATIPFQNGVFSPIYLIAAAIYVLSGLVISSLVRQTIR
jgi:hypothetical protein